MFPFIFTGRQDIILVDKIARSRFTQIWKLILGFGAIAMVNGLMLSLQNHYFP